MYNVPSFVNVIKPKKTLATTLLSANTTKSIDSIINSVQKVLNIYNRAVPIIEQSKPMINNIKTTFKVAKAFKRFSNNSSLEKAFDNLPDFEEKAKENNVVNKVTNPFYPWYTINGAISWMLK